MNFQKFYDDYKKNYEGKLQSIEDAKKNISNMQNEVFFMEGYLNAIVDISNTLQNEVHEEISNSEIDTETNDEIIDIEEVKNE